MRVDHPAILEITRGKHTDTQIDRQTEKNGKICFWYMNRVYMHLVKSARYEYIYLYRFVVYLFVGIHIVKTQFVVNL